MHTLSQRFLAQTAGLALTGGLGLALAAPALAQPTPVPEVVVRAPPAAGSETKHEQVKYADLDLKQQAGAETLVGRIRAAATRVCAPQPTHLGAIKDVTDYQTCHKDAVQRAVKDVSSPMVKQVLDRTGD